MAIGCWHAAHQGGGGEDLIHHEEEQQPTAVCIEVTAVITVVGECKGMLQERVFPGEPSPCL